MEYPTTTLATTLEGDELPVRATRRRERRMAEYRPSPRHPACRSDRRSVRSSPGWRRVLGRRRAREKPRRQLQRSNRRGLRVPGQSSRSRRRRRLLLRWRRRECRLFRDDRDDLRRQRKHALHPQLDRRTRKGLTQQGDDDHPQRRHDTSRTPPRRHRHRPGHNRLQRRRRCHLDQRDRRRSQL